MPDTDQSTERGPTILRAAFAAPMDGPVLRDAAVVIEDGSIAAVGEARAIISAHPSAAVTDLGDAILLPGLVNPHTHLEFSHGTCGPSAGGTFAEWLSDVRKRTNIDGDDLDRHVRAGVTEGIRQCLHWGVTCVGDIAQQARIVRSALSDIAPRPTVVSYGEVLGLAKRRFRVDEMLAEAIDDQFSSPTLRIGITPHAPYTVDRPGYAKCLATAKSRSLPLATHLAESDDERIFLESHSGPFQALWDKIGFWAEPVDTHPGSPIEFASAIGLLDYPTLLAHVNYCDDIELAMLSRGRASVVYCPRTHRYFNHPLHRWREMLAAGINVAVGTDSCASSPDLNLVDELRLLHSIAPEVSVETLWTMATIRAARALQLHAQVGSITVGKRADIVAFRAASTNPLKSILESQIEPTSLWIGAEQVATS